MNLPKMNFNFYNFCQHALQMSERIRVEEQRKFTPVWTMRKDPPSDWHMPLTQEKPQDSWTVAVNPLSLFHMVQKRNKCK